MVTTDVIIIGAGQAGLAMSYALSERGIEHLVIERGRVAERWRSERWRSLQLLTPNWQTRLPGFAYGGPQPDGFMTMAEVIAFFERYAARSLAPVCSQTRVLSVAPHARGYRVQTDRGALFAKNVVLATGYCDLPARPSFAQALDHRIEQLTPSGYREPSSLAPGGVLVVGASASGAQIADELARSGREVTLAVGRHTRLPRRYRGIDIMGWLDRIGALSQSVDDVRNLAASRNQPSLQLVGSDVPRDLDLATLVRGGVRLCGRLEDVAGTRARFADDLERTVQASEAKLDRLLRRIDAHVAEHDVLRRLLAPAMRPAPIDTRALAAPRALDLRAERIGTVLWATGYRRDYGWLQVPVLDACGELVHERGVTPAQGLYAMGLPFQHIRKSSFIDGVAHDAQYLASHIAARLGARPSVAA
jgi:putative flavoprotein involved in K+ transport